MFTKLQFSIRHSPRSLSVSETLPSHPFTPHDFWMRKALDQAVQAFDQGEVPVGAIIVHQERLSAAAASQREMPSQPTAHAAMMALTQAADVLRSWRLLDCTLYVTLEPCCMCAGAIIQARIPRVVYGVTDPKAGACHTLFSLTSDIRLNHQAAVLGGVMQDDCGAILQVFFRQQRALGKK